MRFLILAFRENCYIPCLEEKYINIEPPSDRAVIIPVIFHHLQHKVVWEKLRQKKAKAKKKKKKKQEGKKNPGTDAAVT